MSKVIIKRVCLGFWVLHQSSWGIIYPVSLLLRSLGHDDYFEKLLSHRDALPWSKYKQHVYILSVGSFLSWGKKSPTYKKNNKMMERKKWDYIIIRFSIERILRWPPYFSALVEKSHVILIPWMWGRLGNMVDFAPIIMLHYMAKRFYKFNCISIRWF